MLILTIFIYSIIPIVIIDLIHNILFFRLYQNVKHKETYDHALQKQIFFQKVQYLYNYMRLR